jgi:hypothetical protein
MSKKHLLLMEMAAVVPRSAQGYVSDLENGSENVVEDRLKMLERHCPELVAQFRELPSIGGKRDGAGRPAPLGRKETCSVRLTPDVAEFCRQHPDGFTVLEEKLRASKEFREWLKSQK